MFYAALVGGALLWSTIAGRPLVQLLWTPAANLRLLGVSLGAGLGFGLLIVALSRLMVARLASAQALYAWFAELLGPVSWTDALTLAALSAVGEEVFFRGAMQPSLGLLPTSLLFALVHWPPRLRFASWTIGAGIIGLAVGAITIHTGNLAGAIVAHFVVNLLNLRHVSQFVPKHSQ